MKIERITDVCTQLGEGPVWDSTTASLFFIDSLAGTVFRLCDEVISTWQVGEMIGSLAVVSDHKLVLAAASGFKYLDLLSGAIAPIVDPEADQPQTRFNDGKTDRAGQFIAGTMGIKIRDRALGAFYRLRSDLSIEVLRADVIVANGPCFSPDGQTFYFNDGRRRILACDYNPFGPLQNERVIFEGAEHDTGSDGATVAADGNLWVALTGSSEIGCLSPMGDILARIPMPVRLPSSVMFGGRERDELYVTSISNSGNRTSDEPGAGGLYRISGLGVRGIAEPRFMSSPANG